MIAEWLITYFINFILVLSKSRLKSECIFIDFGEFIEKCRLLAGLFSQGRRGPKYWLQGDETTDTAEDNFTAEFNKDVSFI